MSTRKRRHGGNRQRTWDDINTSFGQDGTMESEAWYRALIALDQNDALEVLYPDAEAALVGHFGTMQAAWRAYRTLAPDVAERFEKVADACFPQQRSSGGER